MALIHLIRHGRSSLTHNGEWIAVPAFDRFIEAYDAAGIDAGEQPTAELAARCAPAHRIVASDMRRAIETAERLAFGRPVETSPLLRECPLALPPVPLPLPMDAWDWIYNAAWMLRAWSGVDTEGVLSRARESARWLASRAAESNPLVVVTHGTFRTLVTRELKRLGIPKASGGVDMHNWSVWTFDTARPR